MKRLFILLSLLPLFVQANPVDKATAMRVAENFWWQVFKEHVTFTDYSDVLSLTEIYLFEEYNDKGFIVISADDRAMPVLGYSQRPFLTHNICPSIASWLHSYEDQIAYARENGIKADETTNAEWIALKQGSALPEPKAAIQVDPLLTSAWNQDTPYNLYCPGEGNNKAPTGCVATALAQVMNYWKYPEHGIGQNSYNYADYTDTNFNWQYGTLSADFEHTHYDWANMVDTLRNSSDSANIKAVALLNYHCGIALNMLYKPGGSMAFVTIEDNIIFDTNYYPTRIAAENIIPRFFGYSSALDGRLSREFDNITGWINLLRDDLQKGRPIIFAGAAAEGPSAGHCFIVDGCNPRLYFHINMGWGGYYDGDYRIDALSPGNSNFNKRQQAIIGMRPPQMSCVHVTCLSATNENSGVFHGGNPVCDKFITMDSANHDNILNIEAGDGEIIAAVIVNNEVIYNYGYLIDGENLIVTNEKNIAFDFNSLEDDVDLKVLFDAGELSIETTNRNASRLSVYSKDKNIMLRGDAISCGSIYDVMGRKVTDFDGQLSSHISVPVSQAGIYIVRTNGESHKVLVRP